MAVTSLPRFHTIPEVARHSRISEWKVRQEIKEGKLRARRIGRCVRILDEDEARWMRGVDEAAS